MVRTEDRSEGGCLQQEPSCPEGRGPSSCPARRVQTGAPVGPRRAPLCARPQGAVALPLNLVGSKFGLLAVTLAALLSSCVFIFPFEPLWRFRPSQKGLNQMSHGRPRPSSLPHALEAGGWGWAAGPTRVGVGKGGSGPLSSHLMRSLRLGEEEGLGSAGGPAPRFAAPLDVSLCRVCSGSRRHVQLLARLAREQYF